MSNQESLPEGGRRRINRLVSRILVDERVRTIIEDPKPDEPDIENPAQEEPTGENNDQA